MVQDGVAALAYAICEYSAALCAAQGIVAVWQGDDRPAEWTAMRAHSASS